MSSADRMAAHSNRYDDDDYDDDDGDALSMGDMKNSLPEGDPRLGTKQIHCKQLPLVSVTFTTFIIFLPYPPPPVSVNPGQLANGGLQPIRSKKP